MKHPDSGEECEETYFGRLEIDDYFRDKTGDGKPGPLFRKTSSDKAMWPKDPKAELVTFDLTRPVWKILKPAVRLSIDPSRIRRS